MNRLRHLTAALACAATCGLSACDQHAAPADGGTDAAPWLPGSYPEGFTEVRSCRASSEHFPRMRVLVPQPAAAGYDRGPYPFDRGTLIVKEEFDDSACRTLTGYTLMRKEAAGFNAPGGDWSYQRLTDRRRVVEDGRSKQCAPCHARCKARDFVCAE